MRTREAPFDSSGCRSERAAIGSLTSASFTTWNPSRQAVHVVLLHLNENDENRFFERRTLFSTFTAEHSNKEGGAHCLQRGSKRVQSRSEQSSPQ
jgi:hypothetical protein